MITVYTLLAIVLTSACAAMMYLGSPHQALLARALPGRPALIAAALSLIAGLIFWILSWGGLVGGLFALAVWMAVSAALPFLATRKAR